MNSIEIASRYRDIKNQIDALCPERRVRIIAVSKTVPAEVLREAYGQGISLFGENRIQEALQKMEALKDLPAQWHFIGHLQTNKAKDAVRSFSLIQSIDSMKLLTQVEKEATKQGIKMDVLLEINLGEEQSKFGFREEQVQEALTASKNLESIAVRGLMTIPPFSEEVELVRPYFRRLRILRQTFAAEFPELTELSMGMSHDYVVAIEEGATMVRIGTALFGERRK